MALNKALSDRQVEESEIARLERKATQFTAAENPPTIIAINHQIDTAGKITKNLREIQQRILSAAGRDDSTHVDAYDALRDRLDAATIVLRELVQQHMDDVNQRIPQHQQPIRLPEITIPKFEGKFEEWPTFEDLFKATVMNNATLSGAQKLHYLKSSLRGEALSQINSFTNTDANFTEAWTLLERRYKNTREIIYSLIRKILSHPSSKQEHANASHLQALFDTCTESLRSLKVLQCPIEHWDHLLIVILLDKLDSETRSEWAKTLTDNSPPSFSQLSDFMEKHIRSLIARGSNSKPMASKPPPQHQQKFTRTHHTSIPNQKCPICNGPSHPLFKCARFIEMTPALRKTAFKKTSLCINCLFSSHKLVDCPSQHTCKKCNQKHHTLLHADSVQSSHAKVERIASTAAPILGSRINAPPLNGPTAMHPTTRDSTTHNNMTLLKTAIVYIRDVNGKRQPCRAFLDDGSEASFISEACAKALGLTRSQANVCVKGVGEQVAAHVKWCTTATLESPHSQSSLHISAYILRKVAGLMPSQRISTSLVETWTHIQGLPLADTSFYIPGKIDILLGADAGALLAAPGLARGNSNMPTASNTIFGWVLYGQVNVEAPGENLKGASTQSYSINIQSVLLEDLVKRFWEIERVPRKPVLTPEESACETHFRSTHTRLASGRYQVRLPFKNDFNGIDIGHTRKMAETRLHSLERRFGKYPTYHQAYIDFMQEYLELGHMERAEPTTNPSYFIPHHFVLKEDSSTTKLRVVFDASALSSTGDSLNKRLMVGPTLQDDLFSILLRFRQHPIALKADIAKMYRQFEIHPKDRDFQRILWRSNPAQPIQEYRLTTVTYGTASAPYLATRSLLQLCTDEAHTYPQAARTLQRDAYVDDLISGATTVENGVKLAKELINLSRTGGMSMRKWISNSPIIMASIPEELRENSETLTFDHDDTVKALGIVWQPKTDKFTFFTKTSPEVKSKRQLLSEVSKTFDPLGWLAPVTIRSKILFQKSWMLNGGWDDEIPKEMQENWRKIQHELPELTKLHIPRCIIPNATKKIELHGFSDASEQAYAACIYLRCELESGEIHVNLLTAKTKVAPLNQQTLPRLELNSAVLLAELVDSVNSALSIDCNVFCYTDSMIVLKWLTSSSRKWKTYVANRVAAIQEVVPSNKWQHVSGVENPADLATRSSTSVSDLIRSKLWWHGPAWLSLEQASIPKQRTAMSPRNQQPRELSKEEYDMVSSEAKNQVAVHAATTQASFIVTWIARFSSLDRLIATTALLLRWIERPKRRSSELQYITAPERENCSRHYINVAERHRALLRLIQLQQQESFQADMKQLVQKKELIASSKLNSLAAFLDADGILRVGGRIQNSTLTEASQHPILLAKCTLAELIIQQTHLHHLHSGTLLTISAVRQIYWIIGIRDFARFIIRKCIPCRKARAALMQQQMGQLPAARVTQNRPFLHTGVDYAGPFNVKASNTRRASVEKCYFAVFICMATKAAHLEYVSGLSTDAFIACFNRFTSRRGICRHLYSDCGTNFVGANKALQQQLRQAEIQFQQHLSQCGTDFHFNPPAAPHQGGLWEAAVKSVKGHMKRVVASTTLTIEQFMTLLTNIEACLNSRPLCSLSTDPTDMQALTPGHFLVGGPVKAIPSPDLHLPMNRLDRWQMVQQLTQHVWTRWKAEYVTTLQQRQKWVRKHANAAVGDLVLIAEDNIPPTHWKLGRIVEVFPGRDTLVRKARVRFVANPNASPVRYADLVRPIQKLSVILAANEME